MLDIFMILMLAASFLVFFGFIKWCGNIVDDSGGDRR